VNSKSLGMCYLPVKYYSFIKSVNISIGKYHDFVILCQVCSVCQSRSSKTPRWSSKEDNFSRV